MNFRYLWMGLATLAGVRRMGFFTPYRYAESVTPPARYPAAEALFADVEISSYPYFCAGRFGVALVDVRGR